MKIQKKNETTDSRRARPIRPTEDIIERILDAVADGSSLKKICDEPGMPHRATWVRWMDSIDGLSSRYARACQMRADVLADDLAELCESALEPTLEDEHGRMRIDNARVNAIKLIIDTRKWAASKLHREKWGDAPAASVNVAVAVALTEDQRLRIMELRRARMAALDQPTEQKADNVIQ